MDESTQEQIECHCCHSIIEGYPILFGGEQYCDDCVLRCELCNNYELADRMADVDGCLVCRDCFNEDVVTCELCEEEHLEENIVYTWNERQLCQECAREEGYTHRCHVCEYLARQEDIIEVPTNINEAIKRLVKLANPCVTFSEPVETVKLCKNCQEDTLSVQAQVGMSAENHLEMVIPKTNDWLDLSNMPSDTKIAMISNATYGMVPLTRTEERIQWVQKILTDINFQIVTNEVYEKLDELNVTYADVNIVTKGELEQMLIRALNEQNIFALSLRSKQIKHQANYNWKKRFPGTNLPETTAQEISMSPFYKLVRVIDETRLDQMLAGWRGKLNELETKTKNHNTITTLGILERNNNNNNTEGDGMRCTLCNALIDENNKTANEAGICQRCIYGEMCPECKRAGYPVCPDCLINYGKQKNKLETKLFQLSNNNTIRRYHDSTDNFIKSTKLRMPDEKPYLYYGIELEMCIPFELPTLNFAKEMLKAGKGLFVAESDSSLDNGVEFISRPLSYKMWKSQEVQQILADMKKIAESFRYDEMSQNSAGMHVHLSKLFFQKNTTKTTNEQIDDLNWIIQNYEKELRDITGREPGEYNRSMFTNIERDLRSFIESRNLKQATITTKIDKTRIPMDHHSMVSMSNSGDTIEVRAFKGTCDPLTIMARIELCRNLAHFARKYSIENMTLDKAFNCKQSPFLEEFIKNNKIKIDSKKKLKSSQNVKIEVKSN